MRTILAALAALSLAACDTYYLEPRAYEEATRVCETHGGLNVITEATRFRQNGIVEGICADDARFRIRYPRP